MPPLSTLFLALGLSAAHADNCTAELELSALDAVMLEAESARADGRRGDFETSVADAHQTLKCLASPMTTLRISRYHVLIGVQQHDRGDKSRAKASFDAAHIADPRAAMGDWVGPGDAARRLFDKAGGGGIPTRSNPAPASGELRFDGRSTLYRPKKLPSVYQRIDDRGVARDGLYLWPEDTPPWYATRRD